MKIFQKKIKIWIKIIICQILIKCRYSEITVFWCEYVRFLRVILHFLSFERCRASVVFLLNYRFFIKFLIIVFQFMLGVIPTLSLILWGSRCGFISFPYHSVTNLFFFILHSLALCAHIFNLSFLPSPLFSSRSQLLTVPYSSRARLSPGCHSRFYPSGIIVARLMCTFVAVPWFLARTIERRPSLYAWAIALSGLREGGREGRFKEGRAEYRARDNGKRGGRPSNRGDERGTSRPTESESGDYVHYCDL